MKVVRGDLIELALAGEFDVIVHGCNCQCHMGGGIAAAIKSTFPEAHRADLETEKGSRDKLGTISHAEARRNGRTIVVVNAYTQFHFRGSGVLADYGAIRSAFRKVKKSTLGGSRRRIGYPKIGAGLARGDWGAISVIVDEELAGEDHALVEFDGRGRGGAPPPSRRLPRVARVLPCDVEILPNLDDGTHRARRGSDRQVRSDRAPLSRPPLPPTSQRPTPETDGYSRSSFARAFYDSGSDITGGVPVGRASGDGTARGGDGNFGEAPAITESSSAQQRHAVSEGDDSFADVEVLRNQCRIMAQHEAAARAQANVGYDPSAATNNGNSTNQRTTIQQTSKPPGPRPKEGRPLGAPNPVEPPLPPPKYSRRYHDAKGPWVPELCAGVVWENNDEGGMADDEHLVRCFGCKSRLSVKKMATLVSCPECAAVGPASSARK